MFPVFFEPCEPIELLGIGVEHLDIVSGRGRESIVGERLHWIEIQCKDKAFPPENQDFLFFVRSQKLRPCSKHAVSFYKMDHRLVKVLEAVISEQSIVRQ